MRILITFKFVPIPPINPYKPPSACVRNVTEKLSIEVVKGMVAMSVYRGKLHKVPDVPRKWVIPTPSISPKQFKLLLRRRSKALALHQNDIIIINNNNEQPQNHNNNDSTQPLLQLDPPPTPNLVENNVSNPILEVKPSEIINPDLGDKLGDSAPGITHIASNPVVSTSQVVFGFPCDFCLFL